MQFLQRASARRFVGRAERLQRHRRDGEGDDRRGEGADARGDAERPAVVGDGQRQAHPVLPGRFVGVRATPATSAPIPARSAAASSAAASVAAASTITAASAVFS